MDLLILVAGLVLLTLLMLYAKLNTFLSLFLVSVAMGFCFQMEAGAILKSVEAGVASTMGSILFLLALGAMFGKILSSSGAADQISQGLIRSFGPKYIQWAVLIAAFIVGLPMFYTAGFVILLPIVFSVARAAGVPLLYIAIPMAASLSVTHGFLPPHPGPSSIAGIYKADMGITFIYGLIIAIPTVAVAGPLWGRVVSHLSPHVDEFPEGASNSAHVYKPGFTKSLFTALFPIVLITMAAALKFFLDKEQQVTFKEILFVGEPTIALFLGVLFSMYSLRGSLPAQASQKADLLTESIQSIAMILLIIAAGGVFKQILVDSGVSSSITKLFSSWAVNPLFVAWALAAIIRVALGSATVAAMASAGMVLPFMQEHTSPELMVLATGAGSLMFSHINDAGFWIFKEYFHLSVKQTILSWSLMETIVSLMGLAGVLILDLCL